jgi:FkbM family methyltransferase
VLDCVVAYNRYGGYVVPRQSAHRVAARKVLAGDVYEPETVELLRRECGEGDVVHAGSFFGDFLPGISEAVGPAARIYAFEPNPESFRCAALTLALNGIDNVTLECAGLGAAAGTAVLQTVDKHGNARGGSSRVVATSDGPAPGLTIEIPLTTIDEAVPSDRVVTILQLDLEGYEQPALEGAMETIRRCRPLIVLETMPDPDWMAEHLTPLGYEVAGRVHYNYILRIA